MPQVTLTVNGKQHTVEVEGRTLLVELLREKLGLTGQPRVVVVHEAPKTCGFGAELVALVNEKAFLHLEAPPVRVCGFDTPFPYTLEMDYLPLAHSILPAILATARY